MWMWFYALCMGTGVGIGQYIGERFSDWTDKSPKLIAMAAIAGFVSFIIGWKMKEGGF